MLQSINSDQSKLLLSALSRLSYQLSQLPSQLLFSKQEGKEMIYGGPLFGLGGAILLAWLLNLPILLSIRPEWVSMKPSTALGVCLSGIAISLIGGHRTRIREALLAIVAFQLSWLAIVLFLFQLFNIDLGIYILLFDNDSPVLTVNSEASIATSVCLFLVGIATFAETFNSRKILLICGTLLTILSTIALIGYLFKWPILFYYLHDYSSAMAFHTALAFLYAGICIKILGVKSYKFANYAK